MQKMEVAAWKNNIPETKMNAVEKALVELFETTDDIVIEVLGGGLSGAMVYRLTHGDKPYVLKVDMVATQSADLPGCMETAAAGGIAPPVHYLDKVNGISITSFISFRPLQAAYTSPVVMIQELAKTIRSIHALPKFAKTGDLYGTVNGLIDEFKTSGMFPDSFFEECLGYYEQIRTIYPWHDTDRVLCHNDLNPTNVLSDGNRIWVIDWDAAFLNDRYVDIATASNFFANDPALEKMLLDTYFGDALTEYNVARFFLMKQVCFLVFAMLMFKMANKGEKKQHDGDLSNADMMEVGSKIHSGEVQLATPEGQLIYGKALFNQALKNMRTSRFAASLQVVANRSVLA